MLSIDELKKLYPGASTGILPEMPTASTVREDPSMPRAEDILSVALKRMDKMKGSMQPIKTPSIGSQLWGGGLWVFDKLLKALNITGNTTRGFAQEYLKALDAAWVGAHNIKEGNITPANVWRVIYGNSPLYHLARGLYGAFKGLTWLNDYSNSRVLEKMWQPETLHGKVGAFTLGFLLDAASDPVTYLSFGESTAAQGGARSIDKVIRAAYGISLAAKATPVAGKVAKEIAESAAHVAGKKIAGEVAESVGKAAALSASKEIMESVAKRALGRVSTPAVGIRLGIPFVKGSWHEIAATELPLKAYYASVRGLRQVPVVGRALRHLLHTTGHPAVDDAYKRAIGVLTGYTQQKLDEIMPLLIKTSELTPQEVITIALHVSDDPAKIYSRLGPERLKIIENAFESTYGFKLPYEAPEKLKPFIDEYRSFFKGLSDDVLSQPQHVKRLSRITKATESRMTSIMREMDTAHDTMGTVVNRIDRIMNKARNRAVGSLIKATNDDIAKITAQRAKDIESQNASIGVVLEWLRKQNLDIVNSADDINEVIKSGKLPESITNAMPKSIRMRYNAIQSHWAKRIDKHTMEIEALTNKIGNLKPDSVKKSIVSSMLTPRESQELGRLQMLHELQSRKITQMKKKLVKQKDMLGRAQEAAEALPRYYMPGILSPEGRKAYSEWLGTLHGKEYAPIGSTTWMSLTESLEKEMSAYMNPVIVNALIKQGVTQQFPELYGIDAFLKELKEGPPPPIKAVSSMQRIASGAQGFVRQPAAPQTAGRFFLTDLGEIATQAARNRAEKEAIIKYFDELLTRPEYIITDSNPIIVQLMEQAQSGESFTQGLRKLGYIKHTSKALNEYILENIMASEVAKYHLVPTQVFIRPEVSQRAQQLLDIMRIPRSTILRTANEVTSWYKRLTLSFFPSTWVRNTVSNAWMAAVYGNMKDPLHSSKLALKTQWALHQYQKARLGLPHNAAAVRWLTESRLPNNLSPLENFRTFQRLGGAQGFVKTEASITAMQGLGQKARIVSSRAKGPVATTWRKVSSFLPSQGEIAEDTARYAVYIDNVLHGLSAEDAIDMVWRTHYNYSLLTPWERKYMSGLFMPFYSWKRFNIPANIRRMFEKPIVPALYGYGVNNIARAMGLSDKDREYLAEFLRTGTIVPVFQHDSKTYFWLFDNWLPEADFYYVLRSLIPDTEESSDTIVDRLISLTQASAANLTPIMRVPIELVSNRDFFRREQIKKYANEVIDILGLPVDPRLAHVMRSLRLVHVADRIFQTAKGMTELDSMISQALGQAILQHLTGIRTYAQDIERSRTYQTRLSLYRLDDLKRQMSVAARRGDMDSLRKLREKYQREVSSGASR